MFKKHFGNWVSFRELPSLVEIDFHWSDEESSGSYHDNMECVRQVALKSLINAQQDGMQYVLFRHGHSTSRIGKTTSRSQVRKLMRSKAATPYIIRNQCIEHFSVFVAAIRPMSDGLSELKESEQKT